MRTRQSTPVERLLPFAAILSLGCGDDSGSTEPMIEDSDSGFTGTSGGTGSTGSTGDPAEGTDTTAETSDASGSGPGYDTLGEGDLRGTLSFTLYAADAANPEPLLGMAGAWRRVDDDIEDVQDFFGVYGLATQWPTPPSTPDTLEQNAVPPTFEWGGPTQWLLAGNGMKLRNGEREATACLLYHGGEPQTEFPPGSGSMVPNYPVYAATRSPNQPEGCAPDASTWEPETDYDIVLYGGELFETNSLVGQVRTPATLEVVTPDVATFGLQIPADEDLTVTWTGDGEDGTRLVIRMFDMFGRMFTVNADDDGSFTIPAADLLTLTAGPATLIVAREHLEEVPFTDGVVRVLSSYAQWGYVELY